MVSEGDSSVDCSACISQHTPSLLILAEVGVSNRDPSRHAVTISAQLQESEAISLEAVIETIGLRHC